MSDAELCLLQDVCGFYTDPCKKKFLNQTINHSKPILIQLLYHTIGGTLKMPSQRVSHDLAQACI